MFFLLLNRRSFWSWIRRYRHIMNSSSLPSRSNIVRSSALVRPCFEHSWPRSILPNFLLLSCYYSSVWFFFLAVLMVDTLCGLHNSCIGYLFPAAHTRWFLVFRGEMSTAEALLSKSTVGFITVIKLKDFLLLHPCCSQREVPCVWWTPRTMVPCSL